MLTAARRSRWGARDVKKETLAVGGSIGISVLIASCCIAPTLFLLFSVSIGALGIFSPLEPYQPYFIGAGLLSLAFAGHRIFWSSPVAADCGEDACAPDSRSRRFTRRLYFVAVPLFTLAIAYPYILKTVL